MSWNWQDLVAMFIVGAAFAYIVSIVYQRMRKRGSGACGGGCFGCKQADPEPTQVIHTIGMSESVDQHAPPSRS